MTNYSTQEYTENALSQQNKYQLSELFLSDIELDGIQLQRGHLINHVSQRLKIQKSSLENICFGSVRFENVSFNETNFHFCELSDVTFMNCSFRKTVLNQCTTKNVHFAYCSFEQCELPIESEGTSFTHSTTIELPESTPASATTLTPAPTQTIAVSPQVPSGRFGQIEVAQTWFTEPKYSSEM